VVANPQSASGRLGKRWARIQDRIRQSFGPFDHLFTSGPGDGANVARRALKEGYEMVVAMGGDGTISEVANGFFEDLEPVNPEAVLGILPFGTGGDLRKTLKLSKKLEVSAAALRGHRTRPMDMGRLDHHDNQGRPATMHFINIASFGMGGLVDHYVNKAPKQLGGMVSFLVATLRATVKYKNKAVRITLDDEKPFEQKVVNVAVANGQYFGGGMHVAPEASVDDGLFDVVTLGDFTTWQTIANGHKIYSGSHIKHPKVTSARARRVVAEPLDPEDAVLLDVDGETPGRLPATFTVLPGAIRVKAPE
jgi:YegS/Rv2252/BmrU family lipid kinase